MDAISTLIPTERSKSNGRITSGKLYPVIRCADVGDWDEDVGLLGKVSIGCFEEGKEVIESCEVGMQ